MGGRVHWSVKVINLFIWPLSGMVSFWLWTMSMLDYNTVFPALVSALTASKIVFGLLYSITLRRP
jgi:hypothetical protein